MNKVTPIYGGHVPGEPVDDVIEVLEDLLARAKAGDLTGIAYALTEKDGKQGTGWVGAAGTRHPLGTALMMLNHRYSQGLLETATKVE